MKKELGKWFLDLAKYLLTAGVVAPWIANSEFNLSITNIVLFVWAGSFFTAGLYLIRLQEKKEEQREKNRNKKRR